MPRPMPVFIPLLALVATPQARAAAPVWAFHDAEHVRGSVYEVVCSGEGPSIGFARQQATDSCKGSAALHLSSEVTFTSMSVTSENQVAYQQEVSSRSRVGGLICTPMREEIEEIRFGYRLWLQCAFDLSRARVTKPARRSGTDPSAWIPAPPERAPARVGAYRQDRHQILTVATVPMCTDLIVRGRGPARMVHCDRNPISLILRPTDREVLVRANGYFPKAISTTSRTTPYEKVFLTPGT